MSMLLKNNWIFAWTPSVNKCDSEDLLRNERGTIIEIVVSFVRGEKSVDSECSYVIFGSNVTVNIQPDWPTFSLFCFFSCKIGAYDLYNKIYIDLFYCCETVLWTCSRFSLAKTKKKKEKKTTWTSSVRSFVWLKIEIFKISRPNVVRKKIMSRNFLALASSTNSIKFIYFSRK